MPQNKPLVTIAMMTYNQEKYVRDSVRGMLAQTYAPLEIVISDDCSTDKTWEIINEEIAAYRKADGFHKNIILNHNEKNLGVALHSNLVSSLQHGVLRVENAGDDISFPCRVEKIVEEWIKDGGKAVIIFHDAIKIDGTGRRIGHVGKRNVDLPLGAVTSYCLKNCRYRFVPIFVPYAYEDRIYAKRAKMQGSQLIIEEPLLYYRVGSGLSSSLCNRRDMTKRLLLSDIYSYRQLLYDLDSVSSIMPLADYRRYKTEFISDLRYNRWNLILLSNDRFKIRLLAALRMKRVRKTANAVALLVFLLPRTLGNLLWSLCLRFRQLMALLRASW